MYTEPLTIEYSSGSASYVASSNTEQYDCPITRENIQFGGFEEEESDEEESDESEEPEEVEVDDVEDVALDDPPEDEPPEDDPVLIEEDPADPLELVNVLFSHAFVSAAA